MTLDDFHEHISVLLDRFSANWRFMNESEPEQWSLELDQADWIEQLIVFIDNEYS